MSAVWSVLADCPHCRTESAVLETMDPDDPLAAVALPVDRRCRMCGWHEAARGGGSARELVRIEPPGDLSTPERARTALLRWAAEEGEPDLGIFCRGVFGVEPEAVGSWLSAGDLVPTSLDVLSYLFPSSGTSAARAVDPSATSAPLDEGERPAVAPAPPDDPRAVGRLLASVMLADGTLRTSERRLVERFLATEELPALDLADYRVWRPSELGPPPARLVAKALHVAVAVAHADKLADESEWRVIRTFAAAWGVDEADLRRWSRPHEGGFTGILRRMLRAVRQTLASG